MNFMSERWKYQLQYGLVWGLVVTLITFLFGLTQKTIDESLTLGLLLRGLIYCVIGVFVLGYFQWRARQKPRQ